MQTIPDITDVKVRLAIYEKALAEIKSNGCCWLCHLLPSIWNGQDHFSSRYSDGMGRLFDCQETIKYFPEFAKYYPKTFPYERDNTQWRITTLTRIISDIKATLNEA